MATFESPVGTGTTEQQPWTGAERFAFRVVIAYYTFDVPAKQRSSNPLLAAIVLALADRRRLLDVFVLNRPAAPADLSFELPPWLQHARRFVKPMVIVVATSGPPAFSDRCHALPNANISQVT